MARRESPAAWLASAASASGQRQTQATCCSTTRQPKTTPRKSQRSCFTKKLPGRVGSGGLSNHRRTPFGGLRLFLPSPLNRPPGAAQKNAPESALAREPHQEDPRGRAAGQRHAADNFAAPTETRRSSSAATFATSSASSWPGFVLPVAALTVCPGLSGLSWGVTYLASKS